MNEFTCVRCGKCCHDVPLSPPELAMFTYILKTQGKWDESRIIKTKNSMVIYSGTCPFLKSDSLCGIYDFRPTVCKLYPTDGHCECVS